MRIRVLLTGRRYQTNHQLPSELDLPDAARVSDALRRLDESLPDDQRLPPSCLVAVSGEHLGTVQLHTDRPLQDGQELVLIAPVAGG